MIRPTCSRILRELRRNGPIAFFFGMGVTALAARAADRLLIVAGLGFAAAFLWVVVGEVNRTRQHEQRIAEFSALRGPDPDTSLFAEKHGYTGAVIGKAIEIWAHASLDSTLPIWELGVDPRSVVFSEPVPRNFDYALERCGGLKVFGPPNSKKYGIAALPLGTMDDDNYTLKLYETDFNTWRTVRDEIEKNTSLRHELSNTIPEQSLVPQSTSLEFLVRFAGGSVLTLKRAPNIPFYPGSWSFSGEEQLDIRDFRNNGVGAAEFLFRRAFIEEVFGKRNTDANYLNRVWELDCRPKIRSYRIWSFFLEANVGIFQTFGVFQLSIEPDDLRALHDMAKSAGWGSPDPEGRWYVATREAVEDLLKDGRCEARRLHGTEDKTSIHVRELHPTSRYRLWRLYRALDRSKQKTLTELTLE